MQLISVNIGSPQTVGSSTSGIVKTSVAQAVEIGGEGLQGDAVMNRKYHGGPDQAVYVYTADDYDVWAQTLGRPLDPGTFGENLTVRGFESATAVIGDCLHIGGVVLQITAPRFPCATLAARMDDPAFVKKFTQAERPGVYCRVLKTGSVQAGDAVTYTPYEWDRAPSGVRVTILDLYRLHYAKDKPAEALRGALSAPIAQRMREHYEELLSKTP